MRGVCDFTDFFVIATGRNARQTKAIYDEVAGVLKKEHELLPRSSAARRGDLDRRRLPRRRAAPLHAGDAGLLPARGAVERRPVGRARSRERLSSGGSGGRAGVGVAEAASDAASGAISRRDERKGGPRSPRSACTARTRITRRPSRARLASILTARRGGREVAIVGSVERCGSPAQATRQRSPRRACATCKTAVVERSSHAAFSADVARGAT